MPNITAISNDIDLVAADVGQLLVRHNDVGVGETIRRTGIWAAADVQVFSRLVKPGMFVVDVGANLGHHTVLFSRLVGSDGAVVGFEPQENLFRLLNANLALNGCDNARAFREALGAAPADVFLWAVDYDKPDNFGAVPIAQHAGQFVYDQGGGEPAHIATGDQSLAPYRARGRVVDFIKIDVQAFELYVLQGCARILAEDRPTIFLEMSPYWMNRMGYDYQEIFTLLEARGYMLVDPHGDQKTRSTRRWTGEENDEWDLLCLPSN